MNEENDYLLSFNSYNSWIEVELYDLNNHKTEYYKWDFKDFFDYEENIDNFEFDLFKSNIDLSYFIAFIPKYTISDNMSGNKFIKIFTFQAFNNIAYNEISCINYEDYLNCKIINVFYMDDCELLVVFYVKEEIKDNKFEGGNGKTDKDNDEEGEGVDQPNVINPQPEVAARRVEIYQNYIFKLYDQDLEASNYQNEIEFPFIGHQLLYFKSIYLGSKYTLFSYIFDINE